MMSDWQNKSATVKIRLAGGKHWALVDIEDVWRVRDIKWRALRGRKTLYARSEVMVDGKKRLLLMHRLLLGLDFGDKRQGDHRNGDGLDNRRSCNLRIATPQQNQVNAGPRKDSSTGVRGVSRDRNGKYRARMQVGKKTRWLGYYDTLDEAGAAVAKAAREIHGEFAPK